MAPLAAASAAWRADSAVLDWWQRALDRRRASRVTRDRLQMRWELDALAVWRVRLRLSEHRAALTAVRERGQGRRVDHALFVLLELRVQCPTPTRARHVKAAQLDRFRRLDQRHAHHARREPTRPS